MSFEIKPFLNERDEQEYVRNCGTDFSVYLDSFLNAPIGYLNRQTLNTKAVLWLNDFNQRLNNQRVIESHELESCIAQQVQQHYNKPWYQRLWSWITNYNTVKEFSYKRQWLKVNDMKKQFLVFNNLSWSPQSIWSNWYRGLRDLKEYMGHLMSRGAAIWTGFAFKKACFDARKKLSSRLQVSQYATRSETKEAKYFDRESRIQNISRESLLHRLEIKEEKDVKTILDHILKKDYDAKDINLLCAKIKLEGPEQKEFKEKIKFINSFPILLKVIAQLPNQLRGFTTYSCINLITQVQDLTVILAHLPSYDRALIVANYPKNYVFERNEVLAPTFLCLNEFTYIKIFQDKAYTPAEIRRKNGEDQILSPYFRNALDQDWKFDNHASIQPKFLIDAKPVIRKKDFSSTTAATFELRFFKFIVQKIINDLNRMFINLDACHVKGLQNFLATADSDSSLVAEILSGLQIILFNVIIKYPLNDRLPWVRSVLEKIEQIENENEKEVWRNLLWTLFVTLIPECQLTDFFNAVSYVPKPSVQVRQIKNLFESSYYKSYMDAFLESRQVNKILDSDVLFEVLNFVPDLNLKMKYIWKYAHCLAGEKANSAIFMMKLFNPDNTPERLSEINSTIDQYIDLKSKIYHIAYCLSDNYEELLKLFTLEDFKDFIMVQSKVVSAALIKQYLFKYTGNHPPMINYRGEHNTEIKRNQEQIRDFKIWFLAQYSALLIADNKEGDLKDNIADNDIKVIIEQISGVSGCTDLKRMPVMHTLEEAVIALGSIPQYHFFVYKFLEVVNERRNFIDKELLLYFNGNKDVRNLILSYQASSVPKQENFKKDYFSSFRAMNRREQEQLFKAHADPADFHPYHRGVQSPLHHICILEAAAMILYDCGFTNRHFRYIHQVPEAKKVNDEWLKSIVNNAVGEYNKNHCSYFYFLIPTLIGESQHAVAVVLDVKRQIFYCVDPQMNMHGALDQALKFLKPFEPSYQLVSPPANSPRQQSEHDYINCGVLAVRNILGIILQLSNIHLRNQSFFEGQINTWIDVSTGLGLNPLSHNQMRIFKGAIYLAYEEHVETAKASMVSPFVT